MQDTLHLGIVQFDPVVGDVGGNRERVADEYATATEDGADLVVTPELSLLGYPPRDLLHRTELLAAASESLEILAEETRSGPPLIVGTATESDDRTGPPLQNSAVLLRDGRRDATYAKRLLPTYDVFDEHRYFQPGTDPVVVEVDGVPIGLTICEDAWHDTTVTGQRRHGSNPLSETAREGAEMIVTLSASPFSLDKPVRRDQRFRAHAETTGVPVAFVNQIGGNDELVFDGHSLVASGGRITERLAGFETETAVVTVGPDAESGDRYDRDRAVQARSALCLGISDYFEKTGFEQAVIGLSGGIDSSVTAALASQALGARNVYGVSLPGSVTSPQSVADARAVATNLGIEFDTVPIDDGVRAIRSQLEAHSDAPTGVTLENIQARVRGIVLMSIANERNGLVLTPDNKSEAAVGYCTLYGDTVGALAPLGDCYKRLVYRMASSINSAPPEEARSATPIPQSVIDKPPTAELRETQTDADDLPPYEQLDPVLAGYIEGNESRERLTDRHDETVVEDVLSRVALAEFKRRQTPPPIRVTQKALGRGWNYPVAAVYDHGSETE